MEKLAFDVGLEKEMVIRIQRRPISENTEQRQRQGNRMSLVASAWVVCLA